MPRGIPTASLTGMMFQETGEAYLVLLTLTHQTGVIRVTSDAVDTVFSGQTFTPYPFDITLPHNVQGQVSAAQLSLDNVSQEIIGLLRGQAAPFGMQIDIVASSDVVAGLATATFTDLQLRYVKYDATSIVGRITMDDFLSEPYPKDTFNQSLYPGLFINSTTDGDYGALVLTGAYFNGTNTEYYSAGNTQTSSPVGVSSFWYKSDPGEPLGGFNRNYQKIISDSFDATGDFYEHFEIDVGGGAVFGYASDAGFSQELQWSTLEELPDEDGIWHNVLTLWNMNNLASPVVCYVDDVRLTVNVTIQPSASFNIDISKPDWFFAARQGPRERFQGCLDHLYLEFGVLLDIDSALVRNKFRKSMGAQGEKPTGEVPFIYCSGGSEGIKTNKGLGNNFISTGTIADCGA